MTSHVAGGPGAGPAWWNHAVRIWLVTAALFLLLSVPDIRQLSFPDPDDALRLAQVRDLLAGQSWFDLHQYRIDPAHGGVLMHWSRLVDVPLAAFILLLSPLFGQPAAEVITMTVVPLLIFGAIMMLVYRLAYRWLGETTAFYSVVALALSVPVLQQIKPLRIDHHNWQILATMVAVTALFSKSPRAGGLIAGTALAVGLSISLEGLPMAAALIGLTALRWLRDRDQRGWTLYAMAALGTLSPLLFVGTRGIGDLALHCDIITPVHLAVFAWGAVAVAALAAVNSKSVIALVGGFAVIGGVALAIALGIAPQCASGAFGELDPLTRALWYDRVHEGLPIWRQGFTSMMSIALGSLIGLYAAIRLARQSDTPDRRTEWFEYALILGAAIAISFLVARAAGVAGMLAAIPLGWQLQQWLRATLAQDRNLRKGLGIAALLVIFVPSGPLALAGDALPNPSTIEGNYQRLARFSKKCGQERMPASVAQLGTGRILAPLDLGPELVADTGLTVIATGHHRGNASMRTVISTFLRTPEVARASMRRLQVDYVILCPEQMEVLNYRYLRPDGFAARLATGRAPDWLELVRLPGEPSRFKVWRVVR